MISQATVMSYPVRRVRPFSSGPRPISISRRKRSLVSITRRQVMDAGSISSRAEADAFLGGQLIGVRLLDAKFFQPAKHGGGEGAHAFLFFGQRALNNFSSSCMDFVQHACIDGCGA